MLLGMEVWDFESHEHTVVEDFSAGLNLFCGESHRARHTGVVSMLFFRDRKDRCHRHRRCC